MATDSDLYFVQQAVGEMANLAYLIGSRAQRKAYVVDPAWNVQGLLDQAANDGIEVVGASSPTTTRTTSAARSSATRSRGSRSSSRWPRCRST